MSAIWLSGIGMLKRSRKALMSSSVSFLVWCTVFLPSPDLPMPKPLTVLISSTVGWSLWFTALWKAAYTFLESWPPLAQVEDFFVRHLGHHLQRARVFAEEM